MLILYVEEEVTNIVSQELLPVDALTIHQECPRKKKHTELLLLQSSELY